MADFENPEGYNGGEVASLLVALMLNMKGDFTAYKSFEDQLRSSMGLSGVSEAYTKSLKGITDFFDTRPDLFADAHQKIQVLLEAMEASQLWGSCKFVTADHLARISRL